jgi:hypothetical protein
MNTSLLSFFNSISGGSSSSTTPSNNSFDVFISAGQSNIDGRNPIDEAPLWLQSALVPRVKVWNNTAGQFNDFKLGVNTGADWNATTSWAFDIIFYKMYRDYQSKDLYIVKRSKGGTPLFIDPANVKGSWNVDYDSFPVGLTKLSQDLETYFLNAKAYVNNYGKTLNIKAFLWYQGGTDVQTSGALAVYKANLIALINRMRTVFEAPNMPFLIVTQSDNSLTYSALLEQYQNEIKEELTNIFISSAQGTSMYEDNIHLNASGSVTVGERTFNILKDL